MTKRHIELKGPSGYEAMGVPSAMASENWWVGGPWEDSGVMGTQPQGHPQDLHNLAKERLVFNPTWVRRAHSALYAQLPSGTKHQFPNLSVPRAGAGYVRACAKCRPGNKHRNFSESYT